MQKEGTKMNKKYMERAITLAKKGMGFTSPNPMVGAVIVKNDKIIGEGYHERYGGMHAERNAIAALTESAQGATMYVTLEPCCHYGKTPPCTEAIIEQKIGKVVIGSRDPNPQVAGKGVQQLRKAGINVVEDFFREKCDAINPVFFHYITTKRPFVAMKYAITMDGKIATKIGESQWITGKTARKHVHTLRHAYKGIMVGIGTVLKDNPLLNCRMSGGMDPVRIICDSTMRIPLESQIVKTAKEIPTIVAIKEQVLTKSLEDKKEKLIHQGVQLLSVKEKNGYIDLAHLMELLGQLNIDSILLEGGGGLNDSALQQGIVQKAYVYIAPKIFGGADAKTSVEGEGISYPKEAYLFQLQHMQQLGEDILMEYNMVVKEENIIRGGE